MSNIDVVLAFVAMRRASAKGCASNGVELWTATGDLVARWVGPKGKRRIEWTAGKRRALVRLQNQVRALLNRPEGTR